MGLNNRKENRKMEQTIQLSDHFGYRRLIRFTIPSILMMIFTSIYGVVDGFFVSNFVGKTSFAAVNFYHAISDDHRSYGIYVWNWWKCVDC